MALFTISNGKISAFQIFRISFSMLRIKILLMCLLWCHLSVREWRCTNFLFLLSKRKSDFLLLFPYFFSQFFHDTLFLLGISYFLLIQREYLCYGISRLFLCYIIRSILQCYKSKNIFKGGEKDKRQSQ